ncbi:MAG: hypothetical protein R2867_11440 [Caldilineaceae bacterium]
MTLISQDVIHSFYVPAFRLKRDVLPGRYTTAWFQATKPVSTGLPVPNIAAPITPSWVGMFLSWNRANIRNG